MAKPCEHLQDLNAADFPLPRTPGACEECLKEGMRWVELRECQACRHVGCRDSSPGRHATRHFHEPWLFEDGPQQWIGGHYEHHSCP
jgi:hypothetical protein